jgi:hypothetical protein
MNGPHPEGWFERQKGAARRASSSPGGRLGVSDGEPTEPSSPHDHKLTYPNRTARGRSTRESVRSVRCLNGSRGAVTTSRLK